MHYVLLDLYFFKLHKCVYDYFLNKIFHNVYSVYFSFIVYLNFNIQKETNFIFFFEYLYSHNTNNGEKYYIDLNYVTYKQVYTNKKKIYDMFTSQNTTFV